MGTVNILQHPSDPFFLSVAHFFKTKALLSFRCAHAAILLPKSTSDGTLNPTPSPVSKASSYTSLPITKPSNAARAQTNDFRTWSQTLQLFPLPESDAEGGTDTDADAESDAKGDGNGKVGKTGKKGGEGDGTGKTDEKRGRIGKRGGIWKTDGKVDANSGGGADADADGEEYADALADVVSDAASSPPGRTGGPDSDSPVGVARPGETSPGEKGKRLGLKTPFGATKEAVGGQLPSPKSATARHATPPGLPRSPVSSPTGRNQPVPSAKALINRVFLALNENNSAGSPAHDPTSAIRHRSPARLPSPRGIPPRKRVPSDGSRDTPVFDVPSIWTLMKPRAEAAPVFGEFDTNLSNDRQTSLQGSSEGLLPDGPRLSADKAPDSRRSSSRRSLDVPLSDGHRTSVGHSSDAHQMNAGQFSDGRWTAAGESLNSRRTSAGQSSDSRRAVREPAPDRRRKSFGLSPDGSRTFNGAPTPSESPSGAQTEAMIAQLREQVDLLTQIGNLRDREFENVASRAKEAEKAAKERER